MEVFNNDDAPIAEPEQHTRIFNSAAKAMAPKSETIDALDLPFFRLGNTTQKAALTLLGPSSSSAGSAAASDMVVEAVGGSTVEEDPDVGAQSDSESDKENHSSSANMGVGIGNALDALKLAFGSGPKDPKAKSSSVKAPAKATGKSKATAKPKVEKGNKRSKPTEVEILKLPPTKKMKVQTGDAKAADDMIVEEQKGQLAKLKDELLSKITETDSEAAIVEHLKNASRDLASYRSKVNKVKKSVKRRNDSTSLIEALLQLIEEATEVDQICLKLRNLTFDENAMTDLEDAATTWSVSTMCFKRGWKSMALGFLKFTDWKALESMNDHIVKRLGELNGGAFFQLLVSEVLQRLLRSLPTKATWFHLVWISVGENCTVTHTAISPKAVLFWCSFILISYQSYHT